MPGVVLLSRRARRRFRARTIALENACWWGWMDTRDLQRRVGSHIAHTDHSRCLVWRRGFTATRRAIGDRLP